MTTVDEIEELRAELRHTQLTATERRDAEARLNELLERRTGSGRQAIATLPANRWAGRRGSTGT